MDRQEPVQVSFQLPPGSLEGFSRLVEQLRLLAAQLGSGSKAPPTASSVQEGMENPAFDWQRYYELGQGAPPPERVQAPSGDEALAPPEPAEIDLPHESGGEAPSGNTGGPGCPGWRRQPRGGGAPGPRTPGEAYPGRPPGTAPCGDAPDGRAGGTDGAREQHPRGGSCLDGDGAAGTWPCRRPRRGTVRCGIAGEGGLFHGSRPGGYPEPVGRHHGGAGGGRARPPDGRGGIPGLPAGWAAV